MDWFPPPTASSGVYLDTEKDFCRLGASCCTGAPSSSVVVMAEWYVADPIWDEGGERDDAKLGRADLCLVSGVDPAAIMSTGFPHELSESDVTTSLAMDVSICGVGDPRVPAAAPVSALPHASTFPTRDAAAALRCRADITRLRMTSMAIAKNARQITETEAATMIVSELRPDPAAAPAGEGATRPGADAVGAPTPGGATVTAPPDAGGGGGDTPGAAPAAAGEPPDPDVSPEPLGGAAAGEACTLLTPSGCMTVGGGADAGGGEDVGLFGALVAVLPDCAVVAPAAFVPEVAGDGGGGGLVEGGAAAGVVAAGGGGGGGGAAGVAAAGAEVAAPPRSGSTKFVTTPTTPPTRPPTKPDI
ncbi:hypothetical protein M427DRAFT_290452 [Gonapodya prolifera JEL478]|uniref:Uncharacterized protein n=1 Tax=Gonapodya prolifera (strain JEL478) TaxID=1344416 RepID=A0A139AIY8_GONPJ|nr:hypothetical protein M427DRAFT_290452 [Gonapodya prolifera JEL478]|eukprot:KXS16423.1 hypothetical protein M427DRAFT_290452 [Gonapodya prolifera JEL478]